MANHIRLRRMAGSHVPGAWVTERAASAVLPRVYVEDRDAVLARVTPAGGEVRKLPSLDGDLRVPTCSDPSGSRIGIWQRS